MSDREKILVQYAILLGLYGEDSQQVDAFTEQVHNVYMRLTLREVVMLYRQEKKNNNKGETSEKPFFLFNDHDRPTTGRA